MPKCVIVIRWLVATMFACTLAGCTLLEGRLPTNAAPAPGMANPNTSGSAAPSAGSPTMPSGLASGPVVRVADGDTLTVQLNGSNETIRLVGIDTPESVRPNSPVECFGKEAAARSRELLTGQTIYLEPDLSQDSRDRYGRLLGFVWLADGRLLNYELIAQGYAFEYTYADAYKYQAAFRAAQEQARTAQRGLWSANTCAGVSGATAAPGAQAVVPTPQAATLMPSAPPAATSAPSAAPTTGPIDPAGVASQADGTCPANYPIKGNINSRDEKIYHAPGQRDYGRTRPERCFATAADAQSAGFRAALR